MISSLALAEFCGVPCRGDPGRSAAGRGFIRREGTAAETERATVLADGHTVPRLALGVWQVPEGRACVDAVRWALEAGYRHIDTAQSYGNEGSVGQALRESGVPREEVFLTTKFFPQLRDPAAEITASLRRLDVDYVDLYLIHWPGGGPTWAWPGMERAHDAGHARSIGVSNFDSGELAQLTAIARVPPVVNQIQLSPFEYRRGLIRAAAERGMAIEGYSPLGTGRHLGDRTVARIAGEIGRTPAQVLLRWGVEHGFVVLPKSTHRERIAENAGIFDFSLPPEAMQVLDALDRTGGTERAQERKWWR